MHSLLVQDPTANDAALAAALAAWDSGIRVRRRGEPSRSGVASDLVSNPEGHGSNGKLKRTKSSDDDSVGEDCEYLPQGELNMHLYVKWGFGFEVAAKF